MPIRFVPYFYVVSSQAAGYQIGKEIGDPTA